MQATATVFDELEFEFYKAGITGYALMRHESEHVPDAFDAL